LNAETIAIAAELLSSLRTSQREPAWRWPLLAVAVGSGLLGTILLIIAADLTLAERLGAPAAAAILGGILAAVALAAFLASRLTRRKPAPPVAALTELAGSLLDDIAGSAQASPKSAALAAFAIGCVVGCTPDLQRGLRHFIH
jgi:Kef-type K+ transport system membrane component KefB